MSKRNLPPEPRERLEPIPQDDELDNALDGEIDTSEKVNAPEMPGPGAGWSDSVYLGTRRALKTLTYVGGLTLTGAGIAIARGVPAPLALLSAGCTSVGSALLMGTEKTLKERSKVTGVRWYESPDLWIAVVKAIPVIVQLIGSLAKKFLNGKDDENGKSK